MFVNNRVYCTADRVTYNTSLNIITFRPCSKIYASTSSPSYILQFAIPYNKTYNVVLIAEARSYYKYGFLGYVALKSI
jgi:hypothetical protein